MLFPPHLVQDCSIKFQGSHDLLYANPCLKMSREQYCIMYIYSHVIPVASHVYLLPRDTIHLADNARLENNTGGEHHLVDIAEMG